LIPKDQKIVINYELDGSPIQLHFRTRYLQWGFSTLVPGDLWLDAVGEADRLEIAVSRFTNAGRAMAEIMSLCANACTALLEPEVAFELAHSEAKREYFQRLVPSDGFAYTSRFVDIESTIALIGSIARNVEKDRIMRSVSHYSEALRNWGMGNELRTLSQLFLGIEAIKTASWRFEAVALGLSKDELAKKWGYDEKLRLTLDAFMDRHARINLIFKGDKDLHKAAKAVSDSFEHGYENFSALYQPAGQALVKTAACLREEIVRVTGVDASAREKILGDQFARPKGKAAQDTYIKGTLVGEVDDPAASGTTYPYLDWENKLTNVSFDQETQKYSFKPNMQFKANLAEGVALTDIRFEIWDGSFFMPDEKWSAAV
jgi:hypothetical protein